MTCPRRHPPRAPSRGHSLAFGTLSRPSKATLQWFAAATAARFLARRAYRAEQYRQLHAEQARERLYRESLESVAEMAERVSALEAAARRSCP